MTVQANCMREIPRFCVPDKVFPPHSPGSEASEAWFTILLSRDLCKLLAALCATVRTLPRPDPDGGWLVFYILLCDL